MKKKILVMAAVFMLVFSFAGQAMASFTSGSELIMVVYKNGGTGNEVAVDLGSVSTDKAPISSTINLTPTSSFALSDFPSSSWSDLSVAFFAKTGSGYLWISGPTAGGQSTTGGTLSPLLAGITQATTLYSGIASDGKALAVSSDGQSYWNQLDQNGVSVGMFAGYTSGGEVSLAALATTGYVDQYLYFYDKATSASPMSGVAIAQIRTYANGTVDLITVSSVPIPAAVWLLGSGLIGLVGIRRRTTI